VYEQIKDSTPSDSTIASYIADFEGFEEEEAQVKDLSEEEADEDIEDPKETVQFLTNNAFLYRTTGEDVYRNQDSVEPAQQFTLSDRYHAIF
jgi:hypothetical protein